MAFKGIPVISFRVTVIGFVAATVDALPTRWLGTERACRRRSLAASTMQPSDTSPRLDCRVTRGPSPLDPLSIQFGLR